LRRGLARSAASLSSRLGSSPPAASSPWASFRFSAASFTRAACWLASGRPTVRAGTITFRSKASAVLRGSVRCMVDAFPQGSVTERRLPIPVGAKGPCGCFGKGARPFRAGHPPYLPLLLICLGNPGNWDSSNRPPLWRPPEPRRTPPCSRTAARWLRSASSFHIPLIELVLEKRLYPARGGG